MSSPTYLIVFCTLAAASLVVVSVINEREERQRNIRQKHRQLRFRVTELEELVLQVDQLMESHSAAKYLNEEVLETLAFLRADNPDASHLNALYETALARHDFFNEAPAYKSRNNSQTPADELDIKPTLDRLQRSDARIAQAKSMLKEALVILCRQQRRGKIPADEMSQLQLDLSWAALMVEVISFVGQGHRCMHRRELLAAHGFYKKAQHTLLQSGHPDPRRQQFIRELTELLHGKRRSISRYLMPENHLNLDTTAESQALDLPSGIDVAASADPAFDETEDLMKNLEAWQA
jgi:hypothetical protein